MDKIQEKLDKLYLEYLDKVFSDLRIFEKVRTFSFSSPLFLDLKVKNGKVFEKKFKLLFIGQQTKGWFNATERKDLDISIHPAYLHALKELYLTFNYGDRLEGPKYNGYLWQFQRPLIESVNRKTQDSFGLLWSNLVRLDEGQDKITDKVDLEIIAYSNNEILRKEIEIIKPEVIVFVTGYTYDWLLKKSFKDLTFHKSSNNELDQKKLAILKSNDLPYLSFRTYHPRPLYQNKYLKDSRDQIIDTIANIISDSMQK